MRSKQVLPVLPPPGEEPLPVQTTRTYRTRVPEGYTPPQQRITQRSPSKAEGSQRRPGERLPTFSAPDTSRGGPDDEWVPRPMTSESPKRPKSRTGKKKRRPMTAGSPFAMGRMTLSGPTGQTQRPSGSASIRRPPPPRPQTAPHRPPPPASARYHRGPNHSVMKVPPPKDNRPPWDPSAKNPTSTFAPGLAGTGITNLQNYVKVERSAPVDEQGKRKPVPRSQSASSRPRSRSRSRSRTNRPKSALTSKDIQLQGSPDMIILGPGTPLWDALSRRDLDALEACVDSLLAGAPPDLLDTCAALLESALQGKADECNLPGGPNDISAEASRRQNQKNTHTSTLYPAGPAFTSWLREKVNRDREEKARRDAISRREERKRRELLRREEWWEKQREEGWADLNVGPPVKR